MLIRQMVWPDIDTVVALEHELFSTPWEKDAFEYELGKNVFSSILVLERRWRNIRVYRNVAVG